MALYDPVPVKSVSFSTSDDIPAAFDALLFKPLNNAFEPMLLKIVLRIQMRQISARPIPLVFDANGNPFLSIPWTTAEWRAFLDGCAAQANRWNGNFWLISPLSFSEYNIKLADGSQFRPNVVCQLDVDFEAQKDPHLTVDVVNLDLSRLAGRDPTTFRSHHTLYKSLDLVYYIDPLPDPGEPAGQHTITHEIGHALGLAHIGVLRRLSLCDLALAINAIGGDAYAAVKLRGGSNADVCYGTGQGIANSGNIMGAGDDFAADNARPWLWAMSLMRPFYEIPHWRAVVGNPGAGTWLQDRQTQGRVSGYESA